MHPERRDTAPPAKNLLFTTRTLGTIGMIGAPGLLLEYAWRAYTHLPNNSDDRVVGVLSIFYITGWICTAVGMRRLRVTGAGLAAKIVFVIQMTALLLAECFSIQDVLRVPTVEGSTFFAITDIAWPFSHVFMLVVGGFVVGARIWKGWRRVAPFVVGLALPAFMLMTAVFGLEQAGFLIFPVATATGFLLLGYAVRTEGSPDALHRSA